MVQNVKTITTTTTIGGAGSSPINAVTDVMTVFSN